MDRRKGVSKIKISLGALLRDYLPSSLSKEILSWDVPRFRRNENNRNILKVGRPAKRRGCGRREVRFQLRFQLPPRSQGRAEGKRVIRGGQIISRDRRSISVIRTASSPINVAFNSHSDLIYCDLAIKTLACNTVSL